jgi:hypothetical protein
VRDYEYFDNFEIKDGVGMSKFFLLTFLHFPLPILSSSSPLLTSLPPLDFFSSL